MDVTTGEALNKVPYRNKGRFLHLLLVNKNVVCFIHKLSNQFAIFPFIQGNIPMFDLGVISY